MLMCSLWKTRSSFWRNRATISALAISVSILGCSAQPEIKASGENREQFVEALGLTPAACHAYRQAYVRGFRDNVSALAADNDEAQSKAQQQLAKSRQQLADAGLLEADCARPYCIIEPLQNGQLDTWCGYRLDADEGEELYQWLDWETVQAALQRSQ